MRNYKRFSLNF